MWSKSLLAALCGLLWSSTLLTIVAAQDLQEITPPIENTNPPPGSISMPPPFATHTSGPFSSLTPPDSARNPTSITTAGPNGPTGTVEAGGSEGGKEDASQNNAPRPSTSNIPPDNVKFGGGNGGAIAGGVVGGLLGLALIGVGIFFLLRHRKQRGDSFNTLEKSRIAFLLQNSH
jgi:hypothetical protein